MNINIYGMNLNTMTSSALTTYGVQLKKRITELQSRQANKIISKEEKKELDASARILDVVASQNKRLITIDAKLKKNGINLGSIKNLTLTSMTKNGIDAIDKKLEIINKKKEKSSEDEIEETKLKNLRRYLTTSSKSGAVAQRGATGIVAFNAVEDALKVTGTGLAIGAAYQVVASAAEAIGNIPVGNELVGEIVKDWIHANMPWLGSAVGLAIAGGACLFIAKKMKEHKMAKNMGYAGAQEAQLEAEEKMIKEQKEDSKNVTLDTLAARAETDPQYLETLKSTLGGRGVDEIISAGPDSTSVTATEYNAARIIKKVQARAAQQADVKEARTNVSGQLDNQITQTSSDIGALTESINTTTNETTNLEKRKNNMVARKQIIDKAKSWIETSEPVKKDEEPTRSVIIAAYGNTTNIPAGLTYSGLISKVRILSEKLETDINNLTEQITKNKGNIAEKKAQLNTKKTQLSNLQAQKSAMGME